MDSNEAGIAEKFKSLSGLLNEQQRRVWAATAGVGLWRCERGCASDRTHAPDNWRRAQRTRRCEEGRIDKDAACEKSRGRAPAGDA